MTRKLLQFDSAEAMLFDGLEALVWQIEMTRSVNAPPPVRNIIPGVLYTFIFSQDAVGGHAFTWPESCKNAAAISLEPDGYSVQSFIGASDGSLIANIPATYY